MGKNNCPICGKRLKNGVCPDCGASFEDTYDSLDNHQNISTDNYDNYKTNTVQNEEPYSGDDMKVYMSKSSLKKFSLNKEKIKIITIVGIIIMIIMFISNIMILPIMLGIVLRTITGKKIFTFLTFIAIVCEIFYFFF